MVEEKKVNWPGFIESDVVKFMIDNELEKLVIEDGRGNKAKLARQKNNEIKVESTSTTLL